jgi:hypothetical protein
VAQNSERLGDAVVLLADGGVGCREVIPGADAWLCAAGRPVEFAKAGGLGGRFASALFAFVVAGFFGEEISARMDSVVVSVIASIMSGPAPKNAELDGWFQSSRKTRNWLQREGRVGRLDRKAGATGLRTRDGDQGSKASAND